MKEVIKNLKYRHLGGSIKGGDSGTYSPELWDNIISKLNIQSMIDVGCGEGISTKYFYDKGIISVGVEGLEDTINLSLIKEQIILHDYTKSPLYIDAKFDLCWCCEFVEHVKEEYINNFLNTFKKCKYVAMTHALPNQHGYHHVNCKDDLYWINIMSKNYFQYNDNFTQELRYITNEKAIYIKKSLLFFENMNL